MTGIGWVQWDPGQKHHYMLRRSDGTCWTACEMWGTAYRQSLLNMVSTPTEKQKCKLCIRALQRSEQEQTRPYEDIAREAGLRASENTRTPASTVREKDG